MEQTSDIEYSSEEDYEEEGDSYEDEGDSQEEDESDTDESDSQEEAEEYDEGEDFVLDDPENFPEFELRTKVAEESSYPALINRLTEGKHNFFQMGLSDFLTTGDQARIAQTNRESKANLLTHKPNKFECVVKTRKGLLCLPNILYQQPNVPTTCQSFCNLNQTAVLGSLLNLLDGTIELVFGPKKTSGRLAKQRARALRNVTQGFARTAADRATLRKRDDKEMRTTMFLALTDVSVLLLKSGEAAQLTIFRILNAHGNTEYKASGEYYTPLRVGRWMFSTHAVPFPITDVKKGQEIKSALRLKPLQQTDVQFLRTAFHYRPETLVATEQKAGINRSRTFTPDEWANAVKHLSLLEAYIQDSDGNRIRLNHRLVRRNPSFPEWFEFVVNLVPNGFGVWQEARKNFVPPAPN